MSYTTLLHSWPECLSFPPYCVFILQLWSLEFPAVVRKTQTPCTLTQPRPNFQLIWIICYSPWLFSYTVRSLFPLHIFRLPLIEPYFIRARRASRAPAASVQFPKWCETIIGGDARVAGQGPGHTSPVGATSYGARSPGRPHTQRCTRLHSKEFRWRRCD